MATDFASGPGSPREWLRHARSDLSLAETSPPEGVLLETLCFHAQQAAEKAIKAVLVATTTEPPPRSHDFVFLLELTKQVVVAAPVPIDVVRAQRLSQYAVLARYPTELSEIDETEWRDAVGAVREVLTWSDQGQRPHGFAPDAAFRVSHSPHPNARKRRTRPDRSIGMQCCRLTERVERKWEAQ